MSYVARLAAIAIAISLSLSLGCKSSIATETPDTAVISFDASVQMTGTTVAAGIGYGWGHGTITYHGTEHAFCVHGVSVGDVGIAHIHAEGLVFHMNHLHDFPGRYYAGSIGVAVIGGESTVLLKNRNGVTLQLESKENGLRFNISAAGLRIAMARNGHCGN